MRRKNCDPLGWAIGKGEVGDNRDYQDQVEADALYELLESDIVPTFYNRRSDRIPRAWISRMKSSIGSLCPFFNTHRMVRDYTERFYLVAQKNFNHLAGDAGLPVRGLASWLERVRAAWPQIRVQLLDPALPPEVAVGQSITLQARVCTGSLRPEDLRVELYVGRINADGEIADPVTSTMSLARQESGSYYIYEADDVACTISGLHGFTARVLPQHPDQRAPFVPGLIAWATEMAQSVQA